MSLHNLPDKGQPDGRHSQTFQNFLNIAECYRTFLNIAQRRQTSLNITNHDWPSINQKMKNITKQCWLLMINYQMCQISHNIVKHLYVAKHSFHSFVSVRTVSNLLGHEQRTCATTKLMIWICLLKIWSQRLKWTFIDILEEVIFSTTQKPSHNYENEVNYAAMDLLWTFTNYLLQFRQVLCCSNLCSALCPHPQNLSIII